jgi:hypothetical protein
MIVTMIIVAGLATVIQVALQAMVVGLDMAQAMAMVADPAMAQAMAMVAGPVMAPQAMAMVVRPVMAVLPHTAHRQPEPIKKK